MEAREEHVSELTEGRGLVRTAMGRRCKSKIAVTRALSLKRAK